MRKMKEKEKQGEMQKNGWDRKALELEQSVSLSGGGGGGVSNFPKGITGNLEFISQIAMQIWC